MKQFFQDEKGNYSMGRLVTFLITLAIVFDCFYSLVFLETSWNLTFEKTILAVSAVTGKVTSLFIERKRTRWKKENI